MAGARASESRQPRQDHGGEGNGAHESAALSGRGEADTDDGSEEASTSRGRAGTDGRRVRPPGRARRPPMPAAPAALRLRWRDHGHELLMGRLRSPRSAVDRAGPPAAGPGPRCRQGLSGLLPPEQLNVVYETLLGRTPDPAGTASYLPGLRDGSMSPSQLAEWIYASSEWWTVCPFTELGPSLHFSRSLFVRSLPRARRILDLGGTALGSDKGAMVLMGYPYAFEELVVVDLPPDDRNDLYKEDRRTATSTHTELGPVHYRYHSMSDLTPYADGSFDLVYSGQSIEHVPVDEADTRPGRGGPGSCAPAATWPSTHPTPRVCRLQQTGFIDPDHDHEYTHGEMAGQAARRRFRDPRGQGPQPGGRARWPTACSRSRRWPPTGASSPRSRDCYLLSYLCRTPDAERNGALGGGRAR